MGLKTPLGPGLQGKVLKLLEAVLPVGSSKAERGRGNMETEFSHFSSVQCQPFC